MNEIEYSEYVVKTQAFADLLGGHARFPEMQDEVARARELDAFASTHDAQLRFTLHAVGAAWSTGLRCSKCGTLGFCCGRIARANGLAQPYGPFAAVDPRCRLTHSGDGGRRDNAVCHS